MMAGRHVSVNGRCGEEEEGLRGEDQRSLVWCASGSTTGGPPCAAHRRPTRSSGVRVSRFCAGFRSRWNARGLAHDARSALRSAPAHCVPVRGGFDRAGFVDHDGPVRASRSGCRTYSRTSGSRIPCSHRVPSARRVRCFRLVQSWWKNSAAADRRCFHSILCFCRLDAGSSCAPLRWVVHPSGRTHSFRPERMRGVSRSL